MSDFEPDDSLHFSDEDWEKLEQQFSDASSSESSDSAGSAETAESTEVDADAAAQINELDPFAKLDDDIAGLMGEKAKSALIVSQVASAELLAAFCFLSDIAASCIDTRSGAIAVLKNLDGDSPEAAVTDLTNVISGMLGVLVVNRADKIVANVYRCGVAVQSFPPPIVFENAPRYAEDLMLGLTNLEELEQEGVHIVDSASFDRTSAMAVIAKHTKYGRGGSIPGSTVE